MKATKIVCSLFALALGLALAGTAGASPDSPAGAPPEGDGAKACCKHHDSADAESGAACAHSAKKGETGPACCAEHAAAKKDGEKAGCCCCDDACERHAEKKTPAKD